MSKQEHDTETAQSASAAAHGYSAKAMDWYTALDVNARINSKDCFKMVCGMTWAEAGKLFSIRERVVMMYRKLRRLGFAV